MLVAWVPVWLAPQPDFAATLAHEISPVVGSYVPCDTGLLNSRVGALQFLDCHLACESEEKYESEPESSLLSPPSVVRMQTRKAISSIRARSEPVRLSVRLPLVLPMLC